MPYLIRNVQVWNPNRHPPQIVAGFYQHGSVSIAIFHSWLNTVLVVGTPWRLFPAGPGGSRDGQPALEDTDTSVLAPGHYVVMSPEQELLELELTSETYRPRTLSSDTSGTPRTSAFTSRVRERDGRCCVTGQPVVDNYYGRFRASHIFPIAHRDTWDMLGLSRYIHDDALEAEQGIHSINSIQNGLLLRADVHDDFDNYVFGVDPDDGYNIVDFTREGLYNGRTLWINTDVPEKYRPSDSLLAEHFKQCVLANVRGTGRKEEDWPDPEDEHDLSNFARWGQSVGAGQPSRLELEVRSRLYSQPATL